MTTPATTRESVVLALVTLGVAGILGCGPDGSEFGQAGSGARGGTGGVAGTGGIAGSGGAAGMAGSTGTVDFVPIYEPGSTWETEGSARQMVDVVFADFEASLRTSGDWNATIEVYLTDDNMDAAHTTFESTFSEVTYNGQRVRVVPAWNEIVGGTADANGPGQPNGSGAEFSIHFNVTGHADNAGLLRHEMMHGLGAVNSIPNVTVTSSDVLDGPTPGERTKAALYDLQLVDLNGNALLANYSDADGTFEVQSYVIETSLAEWMDGDGGVFFRGVRPGGGAFGMACGTFPLGNGDGQLRLNEPAELMFASAHPTWDTVDEPDRAFLTAMGYTLAGIANSKALPAR